MKKIAIVANGTLPIPAVKGGAVENLVQLLIDCNENAPLFQFHVYSVYDANAQQASNHYRNTSFFFIDAATTRFKIGNFIHRCLNYVSKRIGLRNTGNQFVSKVISYLKNEQYDGVLLEGTPFYADVIKRKTGLYLIQRIHNIPESLLGKWDDQIVESTDLFLCISDYVKMQTLKYMGSAARGHVETWYNSIDLDRFVERLSGNERSELRSRYQIDTNDVVVLYSGRIQPYKGVKELLQAFSLISNKKAKLLIVGASTFSSTELTPYLKEINEIAEALKERVVFTGYVPYNDIHKYYQISDFAVLPSIWEEPFALTCLEALASGLPVIISNSGGMVEVVDEECSLIVERDQSFIDNLATQIDHLIVNPGLRAQMGKAASARATFFCAEDHFSRFANVLGRYLDR